MIRKKSDKDSKTKSKEPKAENDVRKSISPNKDIKVKINGEEKHTGDKEGAKGLISDHKLF